LGTVTKISTGSVVSSVGSKVTNVEITVPNPGAIKEGDYATAQVGQFACSSEGTFKNAGKSTIYTKVSGTVEAVNIMVGDSVAYGQRVAVLSNENVTDIDETRDNYEEAQKRYDDAVAGLEDYVVKAPITGTIIQKNIKAGEKLESMSGGSVMAIIADLSSLVFEMSVDELDISKLSVGMDVEVKADAIENVTFGAKVTNISIVGTSNNGVTSYPVKITLNPKEQQTGAAQMNYDKLIPGLNVSASVVIEKAENVIVVPVSAVRRGNIVIVSEDSESEGITIEESIEASRNAFSGSRQGFSNNNTSSDTQKKGGKKYSVSSDAGSFGNKAAGSDGNVRGGKIPSGGKFGKGNIPSDSSGFSWGNKKKSGSDFSNQKPSPTEAEAPKKSDAASPSENTKKENNSKENISKENKSKNKSSDNKSSNGNPAAERIKAMLEAVEVPEGYKAIIVETGLSDESFIEIKRGLSEGDKVLLPDVTSNANSGQGMNGMPRMGGMPGMSGMGGMGGNRNFGGSNNRSGFNNRSGSTNRNFGSR
jgi:multidrug efflux pump subunit AcrA (membrane-fusion protein)